MLLRKLLNPRLPLRQAVIRISIPQSLRHYATLAMHLRSVALHFRSLVLARPGEVSDREEEMRGILGQHARQGRVHGDERGDLGSAHPMNARRSAVTHHTKDTTGSGGVDGRSKLSSRKQPERDVKTGEERDESDGRTQTGNQED